MRVTICGDPHLGKKFTHGVPLHRQGVREAMMWEDFKSSLSNIQTPIHVNLGDLFDSSYVRYDLILATARVYLEAAAAFPHTRFVILKGNHDWTRDLTRRSAFDVFHELVKGQENIHVVTNTFLRIGELAFVGFDPVRHAQELLTDGLRGVIHIFGHWDVEFAEHNLIPTARMAELGIMKATTGHVHKPDSFTRDGVEVVVHGSMQPYAHGQESNDDLYVTLPLSEALTQAESLTDKCVRVLLKPGEVLSEQIDCLQLTLKREGKDEDGSPVMEMGEFNLQDIFLQVLAEQGVPEEYQKKVLDEYQERRIAG